jgi:putative transcriptional regulator
MKKAAKQPSAGASRVEADIIAGLTQFRDAVKSRNVETQMNARRFTLNIPRTVYSAEDVKNVRGLLGVSQTLFAAFLGVSAGTVRAWEQGANEPTPMACRFMDEIKRKPAYWQAILKEMTTSRGSASEN